MNCVGGERRCPWFILTYCYTLREEHRLRVFENRVLRRIFGPKRDEVAGGWKNCIMRSCIVCTLHPVLLG
jgi:hypothetical protein